MGRTPKPWYRAARREWRVIVGGVNHVLLEDVDETPATKAEAEEEYHKLRVNLAAKKRAAVLPTVPVLGPTVVRYLQHLATRVTEGEVSQGYYNNAASIIHTLVERFGDRELASITADDLRDWLYARKWGPTMRNESLSRVKQVWRMAKVEWPDIKPPARRRREEVPTPEQFEELLQAIKVPECREVLRFIAAVGCRPNEAYRLEARHVDWSRGVVVKSGKTTKKTGHLRVIYIPPVWMNRLAALAAERPEGPLFRSERGKPWYSRLVWYHVQQAKQGRNWPWATVYGLRHLFATEALRAKVPIAHVAALLGHTSTAMISKHYSHLTRHDEDLHAALARVKATAGERRKKRKG